MANKTGLCPVCDGVVSVPENTEVSEIVVCPECNTSLVTDSVDDSKVAFSEAPQVEEDWGE